MPHPDGAGLPHSTDPRLSAEIERRHKKNHPAQSGIGAFNQPLAQDTGQESPTVFHEAYAAVATGTEVRYETIAKCFIRFRTTLLWYGTSKTPPKRFRTVPQANSATENGGIPTTLTLKPRCGTVRNHFKRLYSIPYHIPVVRNANKTVQKLPYHDTVVCKHQQPNQ